MPRVRKRATAAKVPVMPYWVDSAEASFAFVFSLPLRVLADEFAGYIMAAIVASLHMETADDLFGTPQGSSRTDKLIAASIQ